MAILSIGHPRRMLKSAILEHQFTLILGGCLYYLKSISVNKSTVTTFILEQTELDRDSIGLFVQLKDNIAQTVHVYSIALLFSVDKSGWHL